MEKIKFKFRGMPLSEEKTIESYAVMTEEELVDAFKSFMAGKGIVVFDAEIVETESSVEDGVSEK